MAPRRRKRTVRRPKTFITDPKEHAKARRRWRSWLPAMTRDLSDLLGKREIFWELQDIAKNNPKFLSPQAFFDWMCRNYIAAASIGIRSFNDLSPDSHSLGRLLYEIIERPGCISRRSHIALYRGMPNGSFHGNRTFDINVGEGAHYVSSRTVRSDLRTLEEDLSRVRLFVNKRIAHRTGSGALRRVPTFNEMDAALDTLDRTLCKYRLLLTASGMTSCFATRQYNWRSVLYDPWIPDRDGGR